MLLLLSLLACGRPDLVSAEIVFVSPEPEEEVCRSDLHVEVDVDTMLTEPAEVVLLAFFDELDSGVAKVLAVEDLSPKGGGLTVEGTLGWDEFLESVDKRVLLVADVGTFGGAFEENETMLVDEGDHAYDQRVGVDDIYARATVSVRTCM